jgi:hypothetical protein
MFPVDSWGTKSGWMMSLLYRIAAKNLELFRDRHCRPFSPGILCVFPDLCVYGSCIGANGMLWFSICPTSSLVAARDFCCSFVQLRLYPSTSYKVELMSSCVRCLWMGHISWGCDGSRLSGRPAGNLHIDVLSCRLWPGMFYCRVRCSHSIRIV